MPFFGGLRLTSADEDERAQKNTFTKWINYHLEEHSSSGRVEDLYEDIKDGVLLCHLIEVLTGEALPVNKTKVSKRVHHIANLTTALTVLRKRGLELINNNAADIADGNPRIVLGLIWQIILHFQIETNIALLKEWGWAATSSREVPVTPPSSPRVSSRSSPQKSPLKQRIVSFFAPSSPSTSRESPRVSLKQMKSSVEGVMLRWVNQEISDITRERVANMDKQWTDGVLFNALVHRWRPDVIDMKRVRETAPRENLENAFEMAHKHLGIRKLLEVDDMLCEKPDKRSIMTYISQFVRTFGERRALQDGHAQHAAFLEWLNVVYVMDLRREQQEIYFRVRREFLEYRSVFNTIMATKMNFTVEELADIERKWDSLRLQLEAAASRAERSLPEPYASLSVWIADGQLLITKPLSLDAENVKKSAQQLQKMISEHVKHFGELPAKQEQLQAAIEKGGLGGRPVAPEFIDPLRMRLATLAEEAPLRLATLRILMAHYHILAYLSDIDEKMDLWKSADSLSLLNRWIKEYVQLHGENPRARCNGYISELRKTLQHSPPTKLDHDSLIRVSERKVDETLGKLEKLYNELLKLKALWTEWEEQVWQLEDLAREGLESQTNTLHDHGPTVAALESDADSMAPMMSSSARIATHHRLEQLRQKMRQMSKFNVGGRLVVEIHPSTSSAPQDERVRTVAGLDNEILKIEALSWSFYAERAVQMVLRERQQRGANELQDRVSRMERQRKLTSLKNLRPQMVHMESLLSLLLQYLRSEDAYERAKAEDVISELELNISQLQKGDGHFIVDTSEYLETMASYLSGTQPGTSTTTVPESTEPPISEEYVREVIERFRLILERRECSEDEVLATRRDVEDCERILLGWNSRKLEKMRQTWLEKMSEMDRWENDMRILLTIMEGVERTHFVSGAELRELRRIEEDTASFAHTGLAVPTRLTLAQFRIRIIAIIDERLKGLKMSGEEDIFVAYERVQEVGEELAAWCPELSDRFRETRGVLHTKMELFKRLQNFYDAVRSLRARNAQWNTITLAQVPQVDNELDVLIERCEGEWRRDAETLKEELGAIQGSFFQLEFDRVNEKLNMLLYEKDKLKELMSRRREFLAAVREFCLSTDASTDISQLATSSDQPTDPQRLINDLCVRLETQAQRLRQLGDSAEMNVTDLSTTAAIRVFRKKQLGEETVLSFESLSRTLEQLLARRLTSEGLPLEAIERLKQEEEAEHRAWEELKDSQREPHHKREFEKFTSLVERKKTQRTEMIGTILLRRIDELNSKFRVLEEEVLLLIQTGRFEELQVVSETQYAQWKEEVGEIENSLGPSIRQQFRPELADLERKALALDGKIFRAMSHSQKLRKHGEKLASKLTTFELWLASAEQDVDNIETVQDLSARKDQLANVLRVVLTYQRLVNKLERLNVSNKEHIQLLISRFYTLRDRLRQYDLPTVEGLPLHIPGSGISQSQISISSLASSEALERPSSVMSVSSDAQPTDDPLTDVAQKLRAIHESYLLGPKQMSLALLDFQRLQSLDGRLEAYLAVLLQNDNDPTVEATKHRLFHLRGQIIELRDKLQTEIDEETALTRKQEEILADLAQLETRVRQREAREIDIASELDHVQMQMDLLKVISNKSRTYVECDVVESGSREGSQSPKRRKRVFVMVSNTVTTIIQVVEEILSVEARVQPPAVLEKINSVKRNLQLLDKPQVAEELPPIETAAVQKQPEPSAPPLEEPLDIKPMLDRIRETITLAEDITKSPEYNSYELAAAKDMLNAADLSDLTPLRDVAHKYDPQTREAITDLQKDLMVALAKLEHKLKPVKINTEVVADIHQQPEQISSGVLRLMTIRDTVDLASSIAGSPEATKEELSAARDMLKAAKKDVKKVHVEVEQNPSDIQLFDHVMNVEQDLLNVLAAIDDRITDKYATPEGELEEVSTTSLPDLMPVKTSIELAKNLLRGPDVGEALVAAEDMVNKAVEEVLEIKKDIKREALVSSPEYKSELAALLSDADKTLHDIRTTKLIKTPSDVYAAFEKIESSVALAGSIEDTPDVPKEELEDAKTILEVASRDLDDVRTAVASHLKTHSDDVEMLDKLASVEMELKNTQAAVDEKLEEEPLDSDWEHIDAVDVISQTIEYSSVIGDFPDSTSGELQAAKEMLEAAKKDVADLTVLVHEHVRTHPDEDTPDKLAEVQAKLQNVLTVVDERLKESRLLEEDRDPLDLINDTATAASSVGDLPTSSAAELQAAKEVLEAAKKDVEDIHSVIREKQDKYPGQVQEPLRKLSSVEENLDHALTAVSERLRTEKEEHEATEGAKLILEKIMDTVNLASDIDTTQGVQPEELQAAKTMLDVADQQLTSAEDVIIHHLKKHPGDVQLLDQLANTKHELRSVKSAVEDHIDTTSAEDVLPSTSVISELKSIRDTIDLANETESTPNVTHEELLAAKDMLNSAERSIKSLFVTLEHQPDSVDDLRRLADAAEDLKNVRCAVHDRLSESQKDEQISEELEKIQETIDLATGIEAISVSSKEDLQAAHDMLRSARKSIDRLHDDAEEELKKTPGNVDPMRKISGVEEELDNILQTVDRRLSQEHPSTDVVEERHAEPSRVAEISHEIETALETASGVEKTLDEIKNAREQLEQLKMSLQDLQPTTSVEIHRVQQQIVNAEEQLTDRVTSVERRETVLRRVEEIREIVYAAGDVETSENPSAVELEQARANLDEVKTEMSTLVESYVKEHPDDGQTLDVLCIVEQDLLNVLASVDDHLYGLAEESEKADEILELLNRSQQVADEVEREVTSGNSSLETIASALSRINEQEETNKALSERLSEVEQTDFRLLSWKDAQERTAAGKRKLEERKATVLTFNEVADALMVELDDVAAATQKQKKKKKLTNNKKQEIANSLVPAVGEANRLEALVRKSIPFTQPVQKIEIIKNKLKQVKELLQPIELPDTVEAQPINNTPYYVIPEEIPGIEELSLVEQEQLKQQEIHDNLNSRMTQLQELPLEQLSDVQIQQLDSELFQLANADELRQKLDSLRKAKEDQQLALDEATRQLEAIEKELAELGPSAEQKKAKKGKGKKQKSTEAAEEDLATLEDRLHKANELSDRLLAVTPVPDSDRVEEARKKIDEITDKTSQEVDKKKADEAEKRKTTTALDELEQAVNSAEASVQVADSIQKLQELKKDTIPVLAVKLEAVGDITSSDLRDRKDALAKKSVDINKALDDKIQKALDEQKKTDDLTALLDEKKSQLDNITEKLQSAQPLADVDMELEQLKSINDELAHLELPQQLARTANDIKQKTKELAKPLEKILPKEKELRDDNKNLKAQLEQLSSALNAVDTTAPETQQPVVEQLLSQLTQLQHAVMEHQQRLDQHSPLVNDSDLDKNLVDSLPALLKKADEQKKTIDEAVQVNTLAPEIKLISAELQQRPENIPENLDEQQAALEDLGARKARLEALMHDIPEGAQGDELREKSQWDLSRLKDLLNQLGAKVGDKLTALAAFNTTRKDAEDNLLAITSRVETGKTAEDVIDQLRRDEEALMKLRQSVSTTDRAALDEPQAREYDDLIARLEKAEDLLKQRRAAAENELQNLKATEELHKKTVPAQSRLAQLIAEADSLLNDPEGVPSQYQPLGDDLRKEIAIAQDIINGAPTDDETIRSLEQASKAAEELAPILWDRAAYFEEFVTARDETDTELERLRQPLEDVLNKPRRDIQQAENDLRDLTAANNTSDVLAEKIRNIQRLSELLHPLESAYADVRFYDVDAEQTEKQYSDILNELAAEIDDDKVLHESANHVQEELAALQQLVSQPLSKDSIANIEQHQLPALKAQVQMLKEKNDDAAHGRKHVAADPELLTGVQEALESLDGQLATAKNNADQLEKDELLMIMTLRLTQLQELPLEQLSDVQIQQLDSELFQLANADELRQKLDSLRKAKEDQQLALDEATRQLEAIEKELAELGPSAEQKKAKKGKGKKQKSTEAAEEDLATLEDRLHKANELSDRLLAVTPVPDSDRVEEARKKIDEITDKTSQEVDKKKADEAEKRKTTTALDELEQAVNSAEASVQVADSIQKLQELKKDTIPVLAVKLEAVGDITSSDLRDRKDALAKKSVDINKALDDKIQKALDEQKKTDDLTALLDEKKSQLDNITEKLQSAQPLADVDMELEQLKSINDELAHLELPQQLARTANDIKQKTKELAKPLEKILPKEKELRDDNKNLKAQLEQLSSALNAVDTTAPETQQPVVEQLLSQLTQLQHAVMEHQQRLDQHSPLVNDSDLDKNLVDSLPALLKKADEQKKTIDEAVQVNTLAPEIKLISAELQQRPENIPENLDEQQAALEDLGARKARLEALMHDIPEGAQGDELREKSQWDLSRLKDLLNQLGAKVGDKLTALAAFNTTRKDAEDNLLAITSRVETGKTAEDVIDQLRRDEEALMKLRQSVSTTDRAALDEPQAREYDDLIARLEKAEDLLKQRRAAAENELQNLKATEELHKKTVPAQSRLAQLIAEADSLLNDPEGVPSQYQPLGDDLRKEIAIAQDIINGAPTDDETIRSLEQASKAAEELAPILWDRAAYFEEFVTARDETDTELERLRQPLEDVLNKPRRDIQQAENDLRDLTAANNTSDVLAEKIRNIQRLSELLHPLESAYADVRFYDVDAEQTEKQYSDILNELAAEIDDDKVLHESANHVQEELAALQQLVSQPLSKDSIANIEQHQLPALKAQVQMLKEKNDDAAHGRKHVAADPELLTGVQEALESLDGQLATAKNNADQLEKDELLMIMTLRLTQLQELPLEQLSDVQIQQLDSELFQLANADELRQKLDSLRKAKEDQQLALDEATRQLEAIEKELAELGPSAEQKKAKKGKGKKQKSTEAAEEDLATLEDRLHKANELSDRLLAVTPVPDSDRVEEARKKIDEITDKTSQEVDKKKADEAEKRKTTTALDELEQAVNSAEASVQVADSIQKLQELKKDTIPVLAVKLEAVGDITSSDLRDRKDALAKKSVDINKALDDKIQKALDEQKKTDDLTALLDEKKSQLDNITEKLQSAQPLADVDMELEQLKSINDELAHLELPQQLARTANDIKQKTKELAKPLEKILPKEKELRDDNKNLKAQLEQLSSALNAVDTTAPETQQPVVEQLLSQLTQLQHAVMEHQQRLDQHSPLVNDSDLDKNLVDSLPALLKKADEQKKTIDEAVQVNTLAPEIKLISAELQQRPENIPENLDEQQAALEDLGARKARLEALMHDIPEGAQGDELREKSQWDLSRLKDLLNQLGAKVGDKLTALAAFNTTRKDAEDNLLAITSRVETGKTAEDVIDQLRRDEEALMKLRQSVSTTDRAALDEPQAREYDDLIARLEKAEDLLKQRRAAAENELQNLKATEELHKKTVPAQSRLAQLIAEADSLLNDPEGVPSQYQPLGDDLRKEIAIAQDIINGAPTDDETIRSLEQASKAAEELAPILWDRAAYFEEFVTARDETDTELERLRQPLEDVLNKPRRDIQQAENDLRDLTAANNTSDVLAEKIRNIQRLSELLHPLESAYADVRFYDVDAEQTEKQYSDILNELAAEIDDDKVLHESANHVQEELAALQQLVSQPLSKDSIANIEQHQLPALKAQVQMLKEKNDDAAHGRKHVAADPELLTGVQEALESLDGQLATAKNNADQLEKDELLMIMTLRLTQLQELPLEQLSDVQIQQLDSELFQLANADELRQKLDSLRKAKEDQQLALDEATRQLEAIEKELAELGPSAEQKKAKKGKGKKQKSTEAAEEDLATLEDRLHKANELSDRLLAVTPVPDSDRVEEARKKIDEITDKTSQEVDKKKADEAEKRKTTTALDELEQAVNSAEASVQVADSIQKLQELKKDTIPVLAVKLEAVGDITSSDLRDRKDALAKKSVDINKALDDKIQKALDEQKKTDDLTALLDEKKSQLDNITEKLQSAQPLADVDMELEQLKSINDELAHLELPQQLARTANDIKQKTKELAKPLEKILPKEKELRDDNKNLKAQLEQLSSALNAVDTTAPETQQPVVEQLLSQLTQLQHAVMEHQQRLDQHSPLVNDSDLDKNLVDSLPALLKKADEQKKTIDEAVQVNTLAPEIKLISAELQQRPENIPENLDEQQAALEDLGARKARLEALMHDIPEGAQGDELREKSQWDLSRLKDLLNQLGAKVGDKLTALAAFNTTRKDAEDNLLAITSRVETGKTAEDVIDQLRRDEEALMKLRQSVSTTDRAALDEPQAREYDDLIARLEKAEDLLKQRRAAAENELQNLKATEELHKKTVPAQSRLAQLIAEADSLLNDPEGVPSQYQPLGDDLRKEIAIAQDIINGAPTDDETIRSLEQASKAAEELAPILWDRAAYFEEFVTARDETDTELERLRQPLEDVLNKPRRDIQQAENDLRDLTAANNTSDVLAEKIRNIQRLSELLHPLESAYADVRFYDVDAEQTEKQYSDILNELAAEIDDDKVLHESANHVQEELAALQQLVSQPLSKDSIANIEQHQLPALKAQVQMLKEKNDDAAHGRKHVAADPELLTGVQEALESLDGQLATAKNNADQLEKDELLMIMTLRLTQLQELPLEQLSDVQIQQLDSELFQLANADELRQKLDSLRKAKEDQQLALDEATRQLEAIEKELAELGPSAEQKKAKKGKGKKQKSTEAAEEDLATLEDRLHKANELSDRLLAVTPVPDSDRVEEARKKIDEITDKTSQEVDKKKADEAEKRKTTTALDELEQAVNSAEASVQVADSIQKLQELKKDTIPVLAVKLEAVGDITSSDLRDRKDALAKKSVDINKALDDKIQKALDEQKKTDDLTALLDEKKSQLDNITEKLQSAQPLADVDMELEQLKSINDELAHLELPQQLARTANDIKQKTKELAKPLEKILPKEKELRDDNKNLKAQLEQLSSALNAVDTTAPETQQPVVEQLLSQLTQLQHAVMEHQQRLDQHSPLVNDSDLDKNLVDSLPALLKKADEQKKTIDEAVQVNTLAPEIKLISAELQQRPENIPENLDEQQAALEDLGARKARLEALMHDIPEGAQGDELREKSQWDLSRLKDLLNQLGAKVGDKLTALAAFNTTRKDAEDNLLAITSRVETGKTAEDVIDQLRRDEEALMKLRQSVSTTDRAALDEPQAREYDDLIARLEKAEDLLKQRRAAAENELQNLKATEELHKKTVPAQSRLAQLIAEADSLLNDPEGVPSQYQPLGDDLRKEIAIAQDIINGAPTDDITVQLLDNHVKAANVLLPSVENKAEIWAEFSALRDESFELLDQVTTAVARSEISCLNSIEICNELLDNLKNLYDRVEDLRQRDHQLNGISDCLPHNIVAQESRFFSVDVEKVTRQYEEMLQQLNDEIDTELNLARTLNILRSELTQCSEEIEGYQRIRRDRMSQESLLNDIIAHIENQKVIVDRSAAGRRFVESSTSTELDNLLQKAHELVEQLRNIPESSGPNDDGNEEYDVDAAAKVLAALYPNESPYDVLQQHGIDGIQSDSDSKSEFDSLDGSSDGILSPQPDDMPSSMPPAQLRRQRSRWRRVLRTALPLQAMLVLLLGAACLVPSCDDEYCCQLLNSFARSFDPSLEFVNGPPPF